MKGLGLVLVTSLCLVACGGADKNVEGPLDGPNIACDCEMDPNCKTQACDEEAPTGEAAGLVIELGGKRLEMTGDELVIGAEGSEHAVDDPEECDGLTSRVAIRREEGDVYRLKDLEMKGFDFKGSRMDNKSVDDGDVFRICQGELRFSIR